MLFHQMNIWLYEVSTSRSQRISDFYWEHIPKSDHQNNEEQNLNAIWTPSNNITWIPTEDHNTSHRQTTHLSWGDHVTKHVRSLLSRRSSQSVSSANQKGDIYSSYGTALLANQNKVNICKLFICFHVTNNDLSKNINIHIFKTVIDHWNL